MQFVSANIEHKTHLKKIRQFLHDYIATYMVDFCNPCSHIYVAMYTVSQVLIKTLKSNPSFSQSIQSL